MAMPLNAVTVMAWRNLWRNYRRTLIMLAAISIGVWAMIFMIAVMRGMVGEMVRDGILNLPGHVQIHQRDYRDDPSIANSMPPPEGELLAALSDSLVVGWSSRVRVSGVIASERDNRGVTIIGIDPVTETEIGFFPHEIIEGRFLQSPDDRGLVIGARLAQRLETRLGKRVVLMSQDPDNNVADRGFRVVGIFQARLSSLEESAVYAGRETLQTMLRMGSQISEVAVLGRDYTAVIPLYQRLASSTPAPLETLSWRQLDPYLDTMLTVMDGFVLVWIIVVFLALSFGLVNTLMMAVFERVREIGLMLALGMRPTNILLQIMVEAILLLLLGLVLGNLLAVATIKPLESGIDISMVAQGMEMVGAGSVLYPDLRPTDMILANVVVVILGLLASLLPAWRAAHLNPVRALTKT